MVMCSLKTQRRGSSEGQDPIHGTTEPNAQKSNTTIPGKASGGECATALAGAVELEQKVQRAW
jgi:hypothetical protein